MTVRKEIKEVFLHGRKDIALIKLESPVNLTDNIRIACLPVSENYNYRELFLHLCTKNSNNQKKVEMVSVSPLSPQDCSILFHRQQAEFSNEEFCAWDENGDDCAGDLGGPLLAEVDKHFFVIGLNSYVYSKVY